MHPSILAVSLLLAASPDVRAAVVHAELPPGARCRQDIRAIDDQADVDMRDANKLIALLEDELDDRAIASSGQGMQDRLRARLAAAKTRRTDIFDKQHDDLNVVRARCDRLSEQERASGSHDPASSAR
jgi:hypothetical protein